MRIGDLSRATGIPVPTIKYYLREGLLSYGERVSANQVRYDTTHEHRLRLVRALLDVGGLSVAAAREVLTAVDDPDRAPFKALGAVHHAVSGDTASIGGLSPESTAEVDALVTRQGWRIGAGNPGLVRLAALLDVLHALGPAEMLARLEDYAGEAERLAEIDIDVVRGAAGSTDALLETLAVSTALGDVLVATLRHLAQTHVARPHFDDGA